MHVTQPRGSSGAAAFLLQMGLNGASIAAGVGTQFLRFANVATPAEATAEFYASRPLTLTKLWLKVTANTLDASITWKLRKNGVDTGQSVTFNAGETGVKSASFSIAYAQDDYFTIQQDSAATVGNCTLRQAQLNGTIP